MILTPSLTPFEIPIGVYRHSAYRADVISEPQGYIGVFLSRHHVEFVGGFGGWDVISHGSPLIDSNFSTTCERIAFWVRLIRVSKVLMQ